MLTGVSASAKHKLRLVIRIRLEVHESFYPLQDKPALQEMAAAPIEEGIDEQCPLILLLLCASYL